MPFPVLPPSSVSSLSFTGSVALSGAGTLTVSTIPKAVGPVTLSGAGTLTAVGVPKPNGSATLSGAGTLTLSGRPSLYNPTSLSSWTAKWDAVPITGPGTGTGGWLGGDGCWSVLHPSGQSAIFTFGDTPVSTTFSVSLTGTSATSQGTATDRLVVLDAQAPPFSVGSKVQVFLSDGTTPRYGSTVTHKIASTNSGFGYTNLNLSASLPSAPAVGDIIKGVTGGTDYYFPNSSCVLWTTPNDLQLASGTGNFVPNDGDGTWYWAGPMIVDSDGKLYVFPSKQQHDASTIGFSVFARGLFQYTWTDAYTVPTSATKIVDMASAILWGAAACNDASWNYIFGTWKASSSDYSHNLYVARQARGSMASDPATTWQFWTTTGWQTGSTFFNDPTNLVALISKGSNTFQGVENTLSAHLLNGSFKLSSKYGGTFGSDVTVWESTTITGPYLSRTVGSAPYGSPTSNDQTYLVNGHFKLPPLTTGNYLLSVSRNRGGLTTADYDAGSPWYRPMWFEVAPTGAATANVVLSGTGTITGAGKPSPTGADALSGSGTLTLSGVSAITGSAGLSGAGTLSLAGKPAIPGSVALAGDGPLTGTAVSAGLLGTAALSGSGTLNITLPPPGIGTPVPFSNNTGGTQTTAATVTLPSNITTGSLGLIALNSNNAAPSTSTPTGWTLVAGPVTNSANNETLWLWTRSMLSSDSGTTVTSNLTVSARWIFSGLILPGAQFTGAPEQIQYGQGTVSPMALPSVTPTSDNEMLVAVGVARAASGSQSGTVSAPWNEDVDSATSFASGVNFSMWWGHQLLSGNAGVSQTGASVTLLQSGVWSGWSMALAPSPAGSNFSGSATLSGTGTLSLTAGTVSQTSSVNLSGSGTLAGNAIVGLTGAQTGLSGSGTLTLAGTPAVPGSIALSGSGTLSFTAVAKMVGSTVLSGAGTLTASAAGGIQSGSAALSGDGTLSLSASVSVAGSSALSGVGALTATGNSRTAGALNLSGAGTLSGSVVGMSAAGSSALSGVGALTPVAPLVTTSGATALSGVGFLNLSAGTNFSGSSVYSGSGTLGIVARANLISSVTGTGSGTLVTQASSPVLLATLNLSGPGSLSFSAKPNVNNASTILAGSGLLTVTGIPGYVGTLILSGSGGLTFLTNTALTGFATVGTGSGPTAVSASKSGFTAVSGASSRSAVAMSGV